MIKSKSRYAAFCLVIVSLALGALATPAMPASSSDPIVKEAELNRWGYRSVDLHEAEQTAWAIETFGRAKRCVHKIKSIEAVPDWAHAYYRFTLTRLVYPNEAMAEKRLKQMRVHPPGVNTKQSPEYVLRDGFRIKETVIFVSTDVLKFKIEQMPTVMKQLRRYKTGSP